MMELYAYGLTFAALTVGTRAMVGWKRAEKHALRLADLNVGLTHRNAILHEVNRNAFERFDLLAGHVARQAEARSRAGRVARSCQLQQTHEKVASRTAQIKAELGL